MKSVLLQPGHHCAPLPSSNLKGSHHPTSVSIAVIQAPFQSLDVLGSHGIRYEGDSHHPGCYDG